MTELLPIIIAYHCIQRYTIENGALPRGEMTVPEANIITDQTILLRAAAPPPRATGSLPEHACRMIRSRARGRNNA
jgi:hypothetical protein